MRNSISVSFISMFMTLLLLSCGSHEFDRHTDMPIELSSETLSIELHSDAILTVSGTDDFTVSVDRDIVEFAVVGNTVTLHAIATGDATLAVRSSDRRTALCAVHVSERKSVPPLTDTQREDGAMRFESKSLVMRYGEPGVMYLYDNSRMQASFIGLDGAHDMVTFCPDELILYIRGEKVALSTVKSTFVGSTIFYQLVAEADGEVMLCVIDRE